MRGAIKLYDGDGCAVDVLRLDYEDPFTLEACGDEIAARRAAGKDYLLARVTTRDKVNAKAAHHSYYNAHQLNKILFKRRGQELHHRYKAANPLTAVNPLTNSIILGEVFYFRVRTAAPDVPAQPLLEDDDDRRAVERAGDRPMSRWSLADDAAAEPLWSAGAASRRAKDVPGLVLAPLAEETEKMDGGAPADACKSDRSAAAPREPREGLEEEAEARASLLSLPDVSSQTPHSPHSPQSPQSPQLAQQAPSDSTAGATPSIAIVQGGGRTATVVPPARGTPDSARIVVTDTLRRRGSVSSVASLGANGRRSSIASMGANGRRSSVVSLSAMSQSGRSAARVRSVNSTYSYPNEEVPEPVVALHPVSTSPRPKEEEGVLSARNEASLPPTSRVSRLRTVSATPRPALTQSEWDGIGDLYRADFVGTDYNYAFSTELRRLFEDNALDETDMELSEVYEEMGGLDIEAALISELMRLNPATFADASPSTTYVDVPYARAVMFGGVASLYILVASLIFGTAVLGIMASEDNRDARWYFSLLPFLNFLCDRLITSMFRMAEAKGIVIIKILLWIFYIIFPLVLFYRDASGPYSRARDIVDIFFPFIFLIYSSSLYIFCGSKKKLV